MKINVLSWNVWVQGNFDEIASFLDAHPADVIALQEVKDDDPGRDVISYLATKGYHHVFAPIEKVWKGKVFRDGPALFSKFPILESEKIMLSQEESRMAIRAVLDLGGQTLTVLSTHLFHAHLEPSDIQDQQATRLLEAVPKERAVVLGDFNGTPDTPMIATIRSTLTDSDPTDQPTWSQYGDGCYKCQLDQVIHRLDYIFTTPDLKVSNFRVEQSFASDHLPIAAVISL